MDRHDPHQTPKLTTILRFLTFLSLKLFLILERAVNDDAEGDWIGFEGGGDRATMSAKPPEWGGGEGVRMEAERSRRDVERPE